jgi:hypothetical protein
MAGGATAAKWRRAGRKGEVFRRRSEVWGKARIVTWAPNFGLLTGFRRHVLTGLHGLDSDGIHNSEFLSIFGLCGAESNRVTVPSSVPLRPQLISCCS